ncbi:NAD(P)/FAD-dependent oxidoreductase [Cellulomonas sp. APG4]|uniref:NAD(P)/FAD-dependent oxidoreductase n=1 Tax=Cellulomonas sp. APG4 TaxID=1538656 RepID=UPI00137B89CF|nr:NAD(P)/FAD-dependent oxidoreductase [Cellulomonas sp. APG4]NCT91062.1 NAD(P)/FAD-dependent oxidoreductase [Cellulomonas sp. APG4]
MDQYDVVVIGGGAAGLSGALTLARARRSVLVVDAGAPRNAPAAHAHGLLGSESRPPREILAAGRTAAESYGAHVVEGRVAHAAAVDGVFELAWVPVREHATPDGGAATEVQGADTATPHTVRARRLLVATGLLDHLPDVAGLRRHWGRDVLHCPYCHGWEVRDHRIGVLGTSAQSVHQALLFRQWSPRITFLEHELELTDEQRERLVARGITLVPGRVAEVLGDDRLGGVRLDSAPGGWSDVLELDALVVASRLEARTGGLEELGLETAEVTMGEQVVGVRLVADGTGRSSVPGVWVAGNATDVGAQVVHSAAAGVWAGAQINADLVEHETQAAVAALRGGQP